MIHSLTLIHKCKEFGIVVLKKKTNGPYRSQPRVVLLEQKMLLSPRRFQGIAELCIRNWSPRPTIRTKGDPAIPIT